MSRFEAGARAALGVWFGMLALLTFAGFMFGNYEADPVMLIAHECALIGLALSLFVYHKTTNP